MIPIWTNCLQTLNYRLAQWTNCNKNDMLSKTEADYHKDVKLNDIPYICFFQEIYAYFRRVTFSKQFCYKETIPTSSGLKRDEKQVNELVYQINRTMTIDVLSVSHPSCPVNISSGMQACKGVREL